MKKIKKFTIVIVIFFVVVGINLTNTKKVNAAEKGNIETNKNAVLQQSKTGWITKDGKRYYVQANGELAKYLQTIDGKTYYFNGSGVMLTGWIPFSKDNNEMHYFNEDGVMQTGFVKVDGKTYYMNKNGAMVKYLQIIDGKTYYFNGSGVMLTGWIPFSKDNNEMHYFNEDGVMQTGFIKVDGKTYYMNKDGAMVKYLQIIDGKTYYFNGSGVMLTGWIPFSKDNNEMHYFNEDGVMQTGFIKIDGKTYYMNKDGAMVKYLKTIDGKTYYFNGSGVMLTGWIQFTSNNKWRYFDENGVLQPSKTGWITKGGKKYYVQANGEVAKYSQTIDGKTYYFNGSGVMLTGWIQFSSNNKWRYFNEDGVMQTGFIKVDGNTYYLDKDGERVEYSQTIDGKTYYFNGSGVMLTGWIQFSSNNEWRYFDENGVLQPSKTGWINKYGKTYYMQSNGELAKYLNDIDGKTYYFNGSGVMLTGWIQFSSNNKWRYFNDDGAAAQYWNDIDGKRYYFGTDGQMFTGWFKAGGDWYYLNPKDGHMMTNTTIDGYYISESGKREDKDDKGDRVVNYAKKFLGTKYVYGGTTPSGFDCSGFTQYVYKHALGIDISRTTYTQINHGKAVSKSDLKVGDLVFPSAGHVGIYIGNGKIIHAPHTGDVVKISNIWSFYAARRIIN